MHIQANGLVLAHAWGFQGFQKDFREVLAYICFGFRRSVVWDRTETFQSQHKHFFSFRLSSVKNNSLVTGCKSYSITPASAFIPGLHQHQYNSTTLQVHFTPPKDQRLSWSSKTRGRCCLRACTYNTRKISADVDSSQLLLTISNGLQNSFSSM